MLDVQPMTRQECRCTAKTISIILARHDHGVFALEIFPYRMEYSIVLISWMIRSLIISLPLLVGWSSSA